MFCRGKISAGWNHQWPPSKGRDRHTDAGAMSPALSVQKSVPETGYCVTRSTRGLWATRRNDHVFSAVAVCWDATHFQIKWLHIFWYFPSSTMYKLFKLVNIKITKKLYTFQMYMSTQRTDELSKTSSHGVDMAREGAPLKTLLSSLGCTELTGVRARLSWRHRKLPNGHHNEDGDQSYVIPIMIFLFSLHLRQWCNG